MAGFDRDSTSPFYPRPQSAIYEQAVSMQVPRSRPSTSIDPAMAENELQS